MKIARLFLGAFIGLLSLGLSTNIVYSAPQHIERIQSTSPASYNMIFEVYDDFGEGSFETFDGMDYFEVDLSSFDLSGLSDDLIVEISISGKMAIDNSSVGLWTFDDNYSYCTLLTGGSAFELVPTSDGSFSVSCGKRLRDFKSMKVYYEFEFDAEVERDGSVGFTRSVNFSDVVVTISYDEEVWELGKPDDSGSVVLSDDAQEFVSFMNLIIEFLKIEFTIFGVTFSYWQVIILSCLAGIVGYFLSNFFG